MQEMYGIEADASRVSRITDKILPLIREWQNCPLETVYADVMTDAIHCKVREEGVVVKKNSLYRGRDRFEGNERRARTLDWQDGGAKFWLSVLNGLKSCGADDVLIFWIDGLTGFAEAIEAVYPHAEVGRCIMHQSRNSTRYGSCKDLNAFIAGLKPVCKAAAEAAALLGLDVFEAQWGGKYPLAVKNHGLSTGENSPRCLNTPQRYAEWFTLPMRLKTSIASWGKSPKPKARLWMTMPCWNIFIWRPCK